MMELWKCYLLFVFSSCTVLTVVESQAVSVDPQVTAYLGGEVTLRCQFSRGDTAAKVVQVIWEKQQVHFAVFHPDLGKSYGESPLKGRVSFTSSSVNDASIKITNVNETDEGTYVCQYTTYPGGTIEGTTTVTVQALAEQLWKGAAAVGSGVGTALLLIVLISAAVYFIVMKRRQRYQAPTCSSSSSRGDQAARVAGDEDEEVQYADIRRCLPAQRGPVPLQSSGATEYTAVNYSTHPGPPELHAGGGEPTYAQVSRS
ncbi:T-cell immunoreceptor with Ig and ITIM domains-like [Conger conger]|uniref:T-cell immunoreceptor with Ig and ITIM domains-like n=1 Tax=Conger conger TaxID=82655 RepID=UPI002A5A0B6E|nr:T-cell immunoreceptor with Ig and ITIM domains-like [Conger conger]